MKIFKYFKVVSVSLLVCLLSVSGAAAQDEFSTQVESLAQKLTSSTMGEVLGTEGELIFINLGEKDYIREGTIFEVVRLGDVISTGTTTIRKERPIGDIEVTRVRPNMSYAKAVTTYAQIKAGDRVYQKRKKIKRVALTEFPYGSVYNDLTKNLYEHLTIYFAQKGLEVVERSKLNSVLQEQKIAYSGIMDISTAQKLGKLVGAEAVLVGSITDLRDDVSLNARLVDVEQGTFLTAALVKLQKTPPVQAMLERGQRSVRGGRIEQSQVSSRGSQAQAQGIQQKSDGKDIVVEQEGFLFKPTFCKKEGSDIKCGVLFINNGEKDRWLTIYRNSGGAESYVYDNLGNQYFPDIHIGPKKSNDYKIEQNFIPQYPIKVEFVVKKYNQNAKSFTTAICIKQFEQRVVIKDIPIQD